MDETLPVSLEEAALDFANDLRKRAGAPPASALLPGRPQDSCFCPIARTAGNGWAVTQHVAFRAENGSAKDTLLPPRDVARFIDAFDAGELPHLALPDPYTVAS